MGKIILISILAIVGYKVFIQKKPTNSNLPQKITIAELKSNIRKYEGSRYILHGKAKNGINLGLGIIDIKGFVLKDDTGEIYVISSKAAPNKDEEVKVMGVFSQRIKIGDTEILTITEE